MEEQIKNIINEVLNNTKEEISQITIEKFYNAEKQILNKINELLSHKDENIIALEELLELPSDNYRITKDLLEAGHTVYSIASKLDVSIATVKKYCDWLIANGYLPHKVENLTEREELVVHLLFDNGLSLSECANELECTIANITSIRNSAYAKGYTSPSVIKVVYPGIYNFPTNPRIDFSQTKKNFANKLYKGQVVLVYVTEIKKIIGAVELTSDQKSFSGRWNHGFDAKWIIPITQGITLKDAAINHRVRLGDTLINIPTPIVHSIFNKLKNMPPLTQDEIDLIKLKFKIPPN